VSQSLALIESLNITRRVLTMTGTQVYNVRGADVTVTANVYHDVIELSITVNTSKLDAAEPDHSAHLLVQYLDDTGLNYERPASFWWEKRCHKIKVKTGSQANRVIKKALAKIDDAISAAIIARDARKSEMDIVFHP
jgi:hypothetical protein